MDIYQALTNDHDKLKPLLARLVEATENNDDTKRLLDQIRDELVPHARAEEAIFYNTLREIEQSKDVIAHAYGEHAMAETILRTLRAAAAINVEWTAAAKKLKDSLEHHIEEEEGKIFARAREVLFDEEARQMAAAFEKMKAETKDQGVVKDTMDLVANLMPKRFADKFRGTDHAHV